MRLPFCKPADLGQRSSVLPPLPRYCTNCGAALVQRAEHEHFDAYTGESVMRRWLACPKAPKGRRPAGLLSCVVRCTPKAARGRR